MKPVKVGLRFVGSESRGNGFAVARKIRWDRAVMRTGEHAGFVVWFEGLSGSGKTTVAREVGRRLRGAGWRVELLDGDEVRQMFSPELGYSRKDREIHA